MSSAPFNPLDKLILGKSVADALLRCEAQPLPPTGSFEGAGIYAIYYSGSFAPYRPLVRRQVDEKRSPIYVGKAVPPGARKAGLGIGINPGKALYRRLKEHSKSIEAADNLALRDFTCKYLVCDDIWIPLGERLLIQGFRPVWNVLIDGFGIHDPGSGRHGQVASRWDTLHPGRGIAAKRAPHSSSIRDLTQLLNDFFSGKNVPIIPTTEVMSAEADDEDDE
jgi:hypothetical protein